MRDVGNMSFGSTRRPVTDIADRSSERASIGSARRDHGEADGSSSASRCALVILSGLEDAVTVARRSLDAGLDALQLWLRRRKSALDPSTAVWAAKARTSITDGSVWQEVAAQPSPRDLYQRHRAGG